MEGCFTSQLGGGGGIFQMEGASILSGRGVPHGGGIGFDKKLFRKKLLDGG